MAEQGTTPREQLVLRHISDGSGDCLIEVGTASPRRWHSVVELKTLTITSVRAYVGRSFLQCGCTEGADAIVDGDSGHSLTLTGVAQQLNDGSEVYGIDVSEGDPEYLIAQRVNNNIGIDLISRAPEQLYVDSLKIPYASEVFVSTDGWYYGDAECVQLLFDVPTPAILDLYQAICGGGFRHLSLNVKMHHWSLPDIPNTDKAVQQIIYGYRGTARLDGWELQKRFG